MAILPGNVVGTGVSGAQASARTGRRGPRVRDCMPTAGAAQPTSGQASGTLQVKRTTPLLMVCLAVREGSVNVRTPSGHRSNYNAAMNNEAEPIIVVTTGGTIDKVYFDALSAFQVGEPAVARLLHIAHATQPFRVVELLRKDSL